MKVLYSVLEVYVDRLRDLYRIVWLKPSQYWDVECYARVDVERSDVNVDVLILLLQQLGVYRNASQGQLYELLSFVREAESGYVFYRDVQFLIAHGCLYLVV